MKIVMYCFFLMQAWSGSEMSRRPARGSADLERSDKAKAQLWFFANVAGAEVSDVLNEPEGRVDGSEP